MSWPKRLEPRQLGGRGAGVQEGPHRLTGESEGCEEGPGSGGSQQEAGAVIGRLEASAGKGFRGELHFLRGPMVPESLKRTGVLGC